MPQKKRIRVGLECSECGQRNYSVKKSVDSVRTDLVLNKYCSHCARHTPHRVSK